jgi:hypothetical protein
MDRRTIFSLSVIPAFGLALLSSSALAQQKTLKEQVTGAWTIVSNNSVAPDGTKHQTFGASPKGMLMIDASGQYSQIIVRSDVPKFKADNRLKGTPEENTAAVQGTTATFGTWKVDEASKTLTVSYVGGMYPNQTGTDGKRSISVTGDQLTINNPATASGMKSDSVWKRAK